MLSNGLVNTVGVNLIHRSIIRFTFSGRRITLFAPVRLVDSWFSQAVEFSAAITRSSWVHIQIVTVWASMMGDIFSLRATDTLRVFFFHVTIHMCKIPVFPGCNSLSLYIYVYIYIFIMTMKRWIMWYCWVHLALCFFERFWSKTKR